MTLRHNSRVESLIQISPKAYLESKIEYFAQPQGYWNRDVSWMKRNFLYVLKLRRGGVRYP